MFRVTVESKSVSENNQKQRILKLEKMLEQHLVHPADLQVKYLHFADEETKKVSLHKNSDVDNKEDQKLSILHLRISLLIKLHCLSYLLVHIKCLLQLTSCHEVCLTVRMTYGMTEVVGISKSQPHMFIQQLQNVRPHDRLCAS